MFLFCIRFLTSDFLLLFSGTHPVLAISNEALAQIHTSDLRHWPSKTLPHRGGAQ